MNFKEKVVFITGGTRGIGKAMAMAFMEEGARVGVNGRNMDAIARFEDEFKGRDTLALKADIGNYNEMEAAAGAVVNKWGRVDILINNAGIVNPLMPAEKIKKDDFERVIDINLKGTFYTTQIFGKKMIENRSGRIISIASQVGFFGEKGFLPYSISRSSLMLMTRSIAHEWSRYGVTACAVAPGFIKGGMNEGLIKKEAFVDFLSKRTPVNRMGSVEELVSLVLFLASEQAVYINGETITFDGGMTGYTQEPLLDFIMKGR
ncbi:MAG: SDR family oxidoreductase [Syntrophorhabdaceae bacterium]|nr:SDR family oxidoreductase [Syntrophorhabdaceae bacterium]